MPQFAKASRSLAAAATEPEDPQDIWCKAAWLSDALELHRDQALLSALMREVSRSPNTAEMLSTLQLAIELFRIHALIVERLPVLAGLRRSVEHGLVIIEQLEGGDPDDPLFIAQLAALRLQLDLLIEQEQDLQPAESTFSSAAWIDEPLLALRGRKLREAELRLRAASLGVPAAPRPS